MRVAFFLAVVAVLVLLAATLALRVDGRGAAATTADAPPGIPVGMLGDSDTESYQDRVQFPDPATAPGGAFQAITLQWPEVLVRMRGHQVDAGRWGVWGVPRWLSLARVRDGLGMKWRGPQRQTYLHNLAWASGCETLTEGPWRQTQRLVDVMDEQPERWRNGLVVIRMGVNTFGKEDDLHALAANPQDARVRAAMDFCVTHIGQAVRLIHQRHPQTRIVLVGIYDNANWSPYFAYWQSAVAQRNIRNGLDHFDNALRAMVASDPRLAFFDDRAWFASHWGQRDDATGKPVYRSVRLGQRLLVTNTAGDSPDNAILANLHAGLAWNVLWTQALVDLVRRSFGLPIDAIADSEAVRFLETRLDEMEAADQPLRSKQKPL